MEHAASAAKAMGDESKFLTMLDIVPVGSLVGAERAGVRPVFNQF
jgi:hypothetical protein